MDPASGSNGRQPTQLTIIVNCSLQIFKDSLKNNLVINLNLHLSMGGGNSSSKPHPQKNNSLLENWETIDHLGDFNIVRNKFNGAIGEVRKFKLNPAFDPQKEIQIYSIREHTDMPIVKSYGSELLQKVSRKKSKNENSEGMCSSNNHLGVITQRIPLTIGELPQLSFQESLYILREALIGYEFLFPKAGPVHVNQKKIGINNYGKVKVWINQDWSQNHPSKEVTSLSSTRNQKLDREYNLIAPEFRDEKQMIQNIIDVIEDKCENGNFPSYFAVLLRQNSHSFSKVKNFVNGFIRDRSLSIPEQIHERVIRLTQKGVADLRNRQKQRNDEKYWRQVGYRGQNKIQQEHRQIIGPSFAPIVHYDAETKKNFPALNYTPKPQYSQNHTFSHLSNGPTFQTPSVQHRPLYYGGSTSTEGQKVKINFGGRTA